MVGFSAVNGLRGLSHRGKIVRTYQPKSNMPDRTPVVRREGNEALLDFLGNPTILEKEPLKQFLLSHGSDLVDVATSRRRKNKFSLRPFQSGFNIYTPLKFAKVARIIGTKGPWGPLKAAELASQIRNIIFARLGSPDQVLDQFSEEELDKLQRALNNGTDQNEEFSSTIFSGLDLQGLRLSGTIFDYCEFDRTALNGADLSGSTFYDCLFYRTDFSGANAQRVQFTNNTRFQGATIAGANFAGASFDLANFSGSLRAIKGKGKGIIFIGEYQDDSPEQLKYVRKCHKVFGSLFPDGFEVVAKEFEIPVLPT